MHEEQQLALLNQHIWAILNVPGFEPQERTALFLERARHILLNRMHIAERDPLVRASLAQGTTAEYIHNLQFVTDYQKLPFEPNLTWFVHAAQDLGASDLISMYQRCNIVFMTPVMLYSYPATQENQSLQVSAAQIEIKEDISPKVVPEIVAISDTFELAAIERPKSAGLLTNGEFKTLSSLKPAQTTKAYQIENTEIKTILSTLEVKDLATAIADQQQIEEQIMQASTLKSEDDFKLVTAKNARVSNKDLHTTPAQPAHEHKSVSFDVLIDDDESVHEEETGSTVVVDQSKTAHRKKKKKVKNLKKTHQLQTIFSSYDYESYNKLYQAADTEGKDELNSKFITYLSKNYKSSAVTKPFFEFMLHAPMDASMCTNLFAKVKLHDDVILATCMRSLMISLDQSLFLFKTVNHVPSSIVIDLNSKLDQRIELGYTQLDNDLEKLLTAINKAERNQKLKLDNHMLVLNLQNDAGQTPLILALKKGLHSDTIVELIKHADASIFKVDEDHKTVLHHVMENINAHTPLILSCLWAKLTEQAEKYKQNLYTFCKYQHIGNDTPVLEFWHILLLSISSNKLTVDAALAIFNPLDVTEKTEHNPFYIPMHNIIEQIEREKPVYSTFYGLLISAHDAHHDRPKTHPILLNICHDFIRQTLQERIIKTQQTNVWKCILDTNPIMLKYLLCHELVVMRDEDLLIALGFANLACKKLPDNPENFEIADIIYNDLIKNTSKEKLPVFKNSIAGQVSHVAIELYSNLMVKWGLDKGMRFIQPLKNNSFPIEHLLLTMREGSFTNKFECINLLLPKTSLGSVAFIKSVYCLEFVLMNRVLNGGQCTQLLQAFLQYQPDLKILLPKSSTVPGNFIRLFIQVNDPEFFAVLCKYLSARVINDGLANHNEAVRMAIKQQASTAYQKHGLSKEIYDKVEEVANQAVEVINNLSLRPSGPS